MSDFINLCEQIKKIVISGIVHCLLIALQIVLNFTSHIASVHYKFLLDNSNCLTLQY